MQLSQLRQKKKKEAVRRLSHGSASTSSFSHGPGQWPQRRKFSDQHKVLRQQPFEASQRPTKRTHISPLHQDAAESLSKGNKPVKPVGEGGFTFATASVTSSNEAPQTTTDTSLTSLTSSPGFGSVFFSTAGKTTASSSASSVAFASTFGANTTLEGSTTSSISHSVFAQPVVGPQTNVSTSHFTMFQASQPVFSVDVHKSTTSTDSASSPSATDAGSLVKEPVSKTLTFSSFNKLGLSSKTLSRSAFDKPTISKPSFTFQMPASQLAGKQSHSSAFQPLFPITTYSTTETSKSPPRTAGALRHTFVVKEEGHQAKEKAAEKKMKSSPTADLTALVIREVPEMFNTNVWLKRFYSRFGEVTKVICNAAKKSATVVFKKHEEANNAKKKGKILRQGLPPVEIFWKQQGRRKSGSSENNQQSQDTVKSARRIPTKSGKTSNQIAPSGQENLSEIKSLGSKKELQDFLQMLEPSETVAEKLHVLEAIDKKLRQVFKRSSDISCAKAVTGSCKDMCPEKERYMREHQRRLSVFEAIPGTGGIDENPQVDHARAIKEYDRSAADKEEPLPHELRPVPVLKMTMDYIATNIMDLVEGREGEWFDFVWNRTRGIRKDITQQHLCDPECVDLVEKTARFHIICAHLLCEVDMNSFDAKINTENLTKCLQTLKQFYGDLYKDKGVTCPCEAEFRAYEILLNLNEGDILREAMTFRAEVQKSDEVRFAMDVFHALNSNNFVRFFRLLRKSKYLSACLLHRYFTQVRSRAVQTLNHSLSVPNRTTLFQLKDLVDILAFEDEAEAEEFCIYYGLSVTDGCVNFQRSSFIEPETRFPMKRALKLIESKRNCSIGETVYNGPLPPPPQHQPCLSFDNEGRYVGDTEELVALLCKENIPPSQTDALGHQTSEADNSERQSQQHPPRTTVVYSGEEIMQFTKALFLEVLNEMCTEITKDALDVVHCCLKLSSEITDALHEEALVEFIRGTATAVITAERHNKRIAQENAATKERVVRAIGGEITEEFVSLEFATIAQEVVREVQEDLLKKARDKASREICLSLIEEGIAAEALDLAVDVIKEEKAERDAKLQLLAMQVIRSRIARYFKRWHKCFRTRVHLKELLSTFPPGAPIRGTNEQLEYLVGEDRRRISMATIRTDAHDRAIHDALEKRHAELELIREQACRPLDIPSLLADSMRKQPVVDGFVSGSPIRWKLLLSLPEGCEEVNVIGGDGGRLISFVIKEKFKRGMYPLPSNIPQGLKKKIDLLSLYRSQTGSSLKQSTMFKVCTKACYGVLTNSEMREVMDSRQFLGACAVMFVVDLEELQLNHHAAREAHIRLRRVLESKPHKPRLPLAVVAIHSDSTYLEEVYVLSRLGVEQLRNEGLLSDCKLFSVSFLSHPDDLSKTLSSTVTWLGRHMFVSSLPKMDSLVNFIEDGLQREFTSAVYEDMFLRKQGRLEEQCPEAIIALFNSVLDHLADVVSSHSLQDLSWPMSELALSEEKDEGVPHVTWNCQENLQSLCSCITALKLPRPPPAAADGTWQTESKLCLEYARSLSPDAVGLLNRVQWILARAKRVVDEIDFLSPSPSLSATHVPWPLVLDACVSFRLTYLHSDPALAETNVYYLEEELESFVPPLLWTQSAKMTKEEVARAGKASRCEPSKMKKNRDTKLHESYLNIQQQLDEINVSTEFGSTSPSMQTSHVVPSHTVTPTSVTQSVECEPTLALSDSAVQTTSRKLKAAVEKAKMESKRFEHFLKSVLGDAESPREFGARPSGKKRKTQSLGEIKKSPKIFEGLDIPFIDLSFGSLEENLSGFNETLKSQRRVDVLTERKLRQWLKS